MGTRGCVAVRREDGGWQGVYNHWDSYPTGLGEEVFEHVRSIPAKYRQDFALKLLRTDDWREYINDGVCEYCGVAGLGQPHTIVVGTNEHQHTRDNGEPEGDRLITSENPDPLFIEWVYVIDPFKQEIEVLYSASGDGPDGYTHYSAGTYPIDEDFDAKACERQRGGYGDDDGD